MDAVKRPNRGWSHGLVHDGNSLAWRRPTDSCASGSPASRASRRSNLRDYTPRAPISGRWHPHQKHLPLRRLGVVGHSRSGRGPRTGRKGRSKVIWGWREDDAERALSFAPLDLVAASYARKGAEISLTTVTITRAAQARDNVRPARADPHPDGSFEHSRCPAQGRPD